MIREAAAWSKRRRQQVHCRGAEPDAQLQGVASFHPAWS